MMQIIRADLSTSAHSNALINVLNSYALDPMGGGDELSAYTKQNLAAELLKRPNITVLFAYEGKSAVGLVTRMEGFSTLSCKPLMNIHDITVIPKYRGRGIASKLLTAVEELAKEKGCCKLTLEVLEGNKVAQAAYQNFGFRGYELDPKMGQALFWEKKL